MRNLIRRLRGDGACDRCAAGKHGCGNYYCTCCGGYWAGR